MVLVIGHVEETALPGEGHRAAAGGDELKLVLIGLGALDGLPGRVWAGGVLGGVAPGVKGAGANKAEDRAMVLVGAGLEREVDQTGALVFGVGGAGDDLELVDGLDGQSIGDNTVVALLVDGGYGDTVDVDRGEIVAGAADDGSTRAALCAGQQCGKRRRIALLAAHLERKVLVGGVLQNAAELGIGGFKCGRSFGDRHLSRLSTDRAG